MLHGVLVCLHVHVCVHVCADGMAANHKGFGENLAFRRQACIAPRVCGDMMTSVTFSMCSSYALHIFLE